MHLSITPPWLEPSPEPLPPLQANGKPSIADCYHDNLDVIPNDNSSNSTPMKCDVGGSLDENDNTKVLSHDVKATDDIAYKCTDCDAIICKDCKV